MSNLQDLYYGSLCPQADSYGITRPRDYFLSVLRAQAPELEPKFNALMTDVLHAYTADTEEMFYQGFGLAVKLLSEALAH